MSASTSVYYYCWTATDSTATDSTAGTTYVTLNLNYVWRPVAPIASPQHERELQPTPILLDEEQKRREEVNERAWKLFAEVLGEEAAKKLREKSELELIGSKGTKFKLLRSGGIEMQKSNRKFGLCARPVPYYMPIADELLAKALLIQNDEDELLRVANRTSIG
jgi:hypothetical protein